MIKVDPKKSQAIYAQIVDEFKKIIIKGILIPEEKIPSIRELANSLKINPNTIQKAYSELEREGYIYIVKGRGAFVQTGEKKGISDFEKKIIEDQLKKIIDEGLYKGLSIEEVDELFQSILKEFRGADTNA